MKKKTERDYLLEMIELETRLFEETDDKNEKCVHLHNIDVLMKSLNESRTIVTETKKSVIESAATVLSTSLTVGAGIYTTLIWIGFEKEGVVTGQTGKEILRSTVGAIFKKK